MTLVDLTGDLQIKAADRGTRVDVGYIYVMEAEGLNRFKIGMTIDIEQRAHRHFTSCPVPCKLVVAVTIPADGAIFIEQRVHEALKAYRVKGEWFDLPPDALARVPEIVNAAAASELRREKRLVGRVPEDAREWNIIRDRTEDRRIAQRVERNNVPTHDLVIDQIVADEFMGKHSSMQSIVCAVGHDRKPQLVHEVVRSLLRTGEVAMVDPLRNPSSGLFSLDEYRRAALCLPTEQCDWELTTCGAEVLVLRSGRQ